MSRLRWLFRWWRQHDDLTREMQAHIAERVDDLVDGGMTEADARAQARRELGNVALQNERSGELWRPQIVDACRMSLRDTWRTFRRSTATIAVCLLVLGASTGLFVTAVVIADALLLRPIRLPGSDRIVSLGGLTEPGLGWTFNDWWGQAGSLERITRWHSGLTELDTRAGRFLVETAFIEPAFLDLFPVRPLLGRTLAASDFREDTPVPIVINESIWTSRFDRSPAVVGTELTLSETRVVIVGILPAHDAFRHTVQVWLPRSQMAAREMRIVPVRHVGGGTHARLAGGATADDARRDIQALGTRLNAEHTPKTGVSYFELFSLVPLAEQLARPFRAPLLALLIGTLAILVMACANAAALLLNLVLDRRQELAVRASLGAARGRLVAQFSVESVLIGIAAGALGGLTGSLLLTSARPVLAPVSPYLASLDAVQDVLRIGLGTGTVLGLGVGLLPLLLSVAWKDWTLLSHRAAERGSRRGRRLRATLVVVQVAAAMMLLTGAGVAAQTFLAANSLALGFDPSPVLTARLVVPAGSSVTATVDVVASAASGAGVASSVAVVRPSLPIVNDGRMLFVGDNATPTFTMDIGPGFFDAMGIPVLAGRGFNGLDARTVVVSETLAARLWPGTSPVGQALRMSANDVREVVGMVPDIRHARDTEGFYPGIGDASLYSPFTDDLPLNQPKSAYVVMRCATECIEAIPQVGSMIEAAGGTVMDIAPLGATIDLQLAPTRLRSVVAGVYAAFGLLLALAGIYGLIRHVAVARTHEVAIRMALGATPAQARRLLIRYGTMTVAAGVTLGTGLAWWLLSVSTSLLYGVTAADVGSYLAAAGVLLAGGVLASIGPALRLGRLDPRRLLSES